MEIVIILVVGCLYFLPSIVAGARDHQNSGAISALNFLLGWTVIGWVAAFVWALTNSRRVEEPAASTVPASAGTTASRRFCGSCGAAAGGAAFCTNCGAKL